MHTLTHSLAKLPVCGALLAGLGAGVVFAQVPPVLRDSKSLELEAVNRDLSKATQRQESLKSEIELLNQDVGAINRALIESTKRGQKLEHSISQSEGKLANLVKSQIGLRDSLNKKRNLLGEILAALQRMGTNPPPALLVQPEDALASVRSAIVLGAVVPRIKSETNLLLSELTALREISDDVKAENLILTRDLNALAEDESRLTLLIEEKHRLANQSRNTLVSERNRAIQLARHAKSLKELIFSLERQIASSTAATQAAKQADLRRKLGEIERLATARKRMGDGAGADSLNTLVPDSSDPARNEPAIAFSQAKGTLLRPVSGKEIYGFGDTLGSRGNSQHVAMTTRSNARVRSPTDGWVVYAGPFRSYGQILILNAGEEYHMVLSGLWEVNVETGQFVLAGEPVGRMGLTRFAAVIPLDLGSNKPILTVELRRNGKSVDPAPWWAIGKKADTQVRPKQGT